VRIGEGAIRSCVVLAKRYVQDRAPPDRARDLLEHAKGDSKDRFSQRGLGETGRGGGSPKHSGEGACRRRSLTDGTKHPLRRYRPVEIGILRSLRAPHTTTATATAGIVGIIAPTGPSPGLATARLPY